MFSFSLQKLVVTNKTLLPLTGSARSDLRWRDPDALFQELRNAYSGEVTGIRREEEMEMSEDDCEDSPCKRMRTGERSWTTSQSGLKEKGNRSST